LPPNAKPNSAKLRAMAQPGAPRQCAPKSVPLAEELRAWAGPAAEMPLWVAELVVPAVPVAWAQLARALPTALKAALLQA